VKLKQRLAECLGGETAHRAFVVELHLPFGGLNVDVTVPGSSSRNRQQTGSGLS